MNRPLFSLSSELPPDFVSPQDPREMQHSLQKALAELQRGLRLSQQDLQGQIFDLEGVLCWWESRRAATNSLTQAKVWATLIESAQTLLQRYQEQLPSPHPTTPHSTA